MLYPSRKGESVDAIHDRAEEVLRKLIAKWDKAGIERVVVFTHAATVSISPFSYQPA